MDRFFRPYEIRPGGPIRILIESEDGSRVEVVGKVERVPLVAAPSQVMHLHVTGARITRLPPA
jgi:hypothetical protein